MGFVKGLQGGFLEAGFGLSGFLAGSRVLGFRNVITRMEMYTYVSTYIHTSFTLQGGLQGFGRSASLF